MAYDPPYDTEYLKKHYPCVKKGTHVESPLRGYHYARPGGPPANMLNLPLPEQKQILKWYKEHSYDKNAKRYLRDRIILENALRVVAEKKLGKVEMKHPLYFQLGRAKVEDRFDETGAGEYKIHPDLLTCATFSPGDSFDFLRMLERTRPLRKGEKHAPIKGPPDAKQLLRKVEEGLMSKKELEQRGVKNIPVWQRPHGNYIEGHIWAPFDIKGKTIVPMDKKAAVLYHGSPKKLKILAPKNLHGEPDIASAVFATPSREFALPYAGGRWADWDINQSTQSEDGVRKVTLQEMRPGAFKEIFDGKKGYMYTVPKESFKPLPSLAYKKPSTWEVISEKSVEPVKVEEISDVGKALRRAGVQMRPYEYKDTLKVLRRREKRISLVPLKIQRGYYKRWMEKAPPEIVAELKSRMEKKAAFFQAFIDESERLAGYGEAPPPDMGLAGDGVGARKLPAVPPPTTRAFGKAFSSRGAHYKVAQEMPFPGEYRDSLLKGTKNTTVRVGEEMGKYQPGGIYPATNYKGVSLGVNIKVQSVQSLPVSALGAATRSTTANMVQKKYNLTPLDRVEVIKFEVQR